ncbi:hypothetical protein ACGF0D_35955 [Kitasatospora sp. NPDC048298]|uniref:hypothetical protein n=1 Tax=Kitasatospora sp. NPDC048298 TaxID=3364049 RepID=UPI00371F245A
MAIDVVDSVRLVNTNRQRHKRLLEREEELDRRAARDNAAVQEARRRLHDEALVPFRDVFHRLKQIDPVEPATIERLAVGGEAGVEPPRLRRITVPPVVVLLAGGALQVVVPLVVGHAVKAGSYGAVRAFGSASTGTAIRTLYGAAERNAVEAWFGRVVAGGGGKAAGQRVLTEIGKTSADLTREVVARLQSQAFEDARRRKARDLDRREAKARTRQDEAPALYERGKDMQFVLQNLRAELVRRLPSFTALVEECDDFARYDSRRRAEVAAMLDLDGLAVRVMNCPITDADGRLTEESGRVVADAEARLRALEAES